MKQSHCLKPKHQHYRYLAIVFTTIILTLICTVFIVPKDALALGITPPYNPASNLSTPSNVTANCPFTINQTVDDTQSCYLASLAAIDNAELGEGSSPIILPTNYLSLSVANQLYVVINAERVARQLPPIPGEVAGLNVTAQQGAVVSGDPGISGQYTIGPWDSIWAGNQQMSLLADYGWMYQDGPGQYGYNADCTATVTSGCWGHRDAILGNYTCNPCGMGVGFSYHAFSNSPSEYYPSYAAEFNSGNNGQSYTYVFTYSQQVVPYLTPAPSVTTISANTISGNNLANTAEVLIGSYIVNSITNTSNNTITFNMPTLPAGNYPVRVITPGGESPINPTAYLNITTSNPASVPQITNQIQELGYGFVVTPASPSTPINIQQICSNCIPASEVHNPYANLVYPPTVQPPTSTPPTPTSNPSSPVATTIPPPTPIITPIIDSVYPKSAPNNTSLVITGLHFNNVKAIYFGTTKAPSFYVLSTSRLIVVVPKSTIQKVNITVVTKTSKSPVTSAGVFIYTRQKSNIPAQLEAVNTVDTQSNPSFIIILTIMAGFIVESIIVWRYRKHLQNRENS